MAIHYPRRGTLQDPRARADLGLAARGLRRRDETSRDAELFRELVDFERCVPLLLVLRDDPFLCVSVRDSGRGAELVEEVFAADAEGCFLAGGAVVQACVDYLFIVTQSMCFLFHAMA